MFVDTNVPECHNFLLQKTVGCMKDVVQALRLLIQTSHFPAKICVAVSPQPHVVSSHEAAS